VVRIVDYLLVTTHDRSGRTPAGHRVSVDLPEHVRIERLEPDLSDRLLDATSLRGEDWDPPRTYHVVHAYVRDVWTEASGEPPDETFHWDHDRRMWPTVQLSRLIRDNATSTEHAARRMIRADGTEVLIPFDGYASHTVYRLYPDRPGWLDVAEAEELRALLDAHTNGPPLPARVGRALRQVDAITSVRYLEEAMPSVVGGFESLVKIGRASLTAQFSQRVPAVAGEVGVEPSVAECEEVYDDRSALVHGVGVDLSEPHEVDEFGRRFNALQETLRRVVRRAIKDREFAGTFDDDASITARWPTVARLRNGGELII
jgi:hypothetical protein